MAAYRGGQGRFRKLQTNIKDVELSVIALDTNTQHTALFVCV